MIAGLILEYLLIGIMPNLYLIGQIVGKNMTLFEIVSWFFLLIIIFVPIRKNFSLKKMKKLSFGTDLLILFLLTTATNVIIFTVAVMNGSLYGAKSRLIYGLIVFLSEFFVFWSGIIRVYIYSKQVSLKLKLLGIFFGFVPIVNLILLIKIISAAKAEVSYETKFETEQLARDGKNLCRTKYPILLVHGVFFRDNKLLNYWGRIPEVLKRNGADLFYGQQQSALAVKDSALELHNKIQEVLKQTGAEKVNVIAHSKGGLDTRYAISKYGADKYIASLTTVNTPHRGCIFVDYLFSVIPESMRNKMASTYNAGAKKLGDTTPDFIAAVTDLSGSACEIFNSEVKDSPNVYYQSVGSMSRNAKSGRFPLNVSYPLVKAKDGDNDGLVAVTSMKWGDNFKFVSVNGKRGVTHADMIDLNRENIPDFNVRSFYVNLVSDLKNKGF